jgi:hypothetical protein
MVSIPLLIAAWQFYIRHMIHTEPGLGAVAGGIAPSLLVFAIVFLAGFAWNWRITRQ